MDKISLKLIKILLLSSLLVSGLANSSSAAPLPKFGTEFHGFWNYSDLAEQTSALQQLKAAGATWVRMDVGWVTVEGTKNSYSPWALSKYDASVNLANSLGFNILLTIKDTPNWAHDSTNIRQAPNDPNDYAEFARDISIRYGDKVNAIELWNEPNSSDFFVANVAGQEASEYSALVKSAYTEIKTNGFPGTVVLAGGTSYIDTNWWAKLYGLGLKNYTDVIAVNPYPGISNESPLLPANGNKWRMNHLPKLLNVMRTNGDGAKPIWFTEFGWSSHAYYSSSNWNQGVTEAQQAQYLTQTIELVSTKYPQVQNVFWYNLRDRTDGSIHINNFGLLRNDLTPKPSYSALAALYQYGEKSTHDNLMLASESEKSLVKTVFIAIAIFSLAALAGWATLNRSRITTYIKRN